MRLGLNVGYSGSRMAIDMPLVQEADRLGYHSVWAAEAYGSDAVTPLAWIAGQTKSIHVGSAIMQMPARSPAMTAMTATTLDQLSNGRFLLGLGVSGPQVVEGWHGVMYGKPLVRTREYVSIVRKIWAREQPLEHGGEHYQIPYRGAGATGLGKPLKSILHGRQIPIYIAAIGPKSVEQTAEIADGWLPIFYSPYRTHAYRDALEAGFKRAGGGKSLATFDVAPSVTVIQGDDVQACLDFVKPMLALYVGGMGARGKNFYNSLTQRYGYEEAAAKIQDLYLGGNKRDAEAKVPLEWLEAGISTLLIQTRQQEALGVMAELLL